MNKIILSIISSLFFICSASAEVTKDVQVIGEYYYGTIKVICIQVIQA